MNDREGGLPLSPQELARAYDRLVSARWRGEDESANTLATWFEAHWTGQAPPEPGDPPAGASVFGGGGGGIRWYTGSDAVLGYVSGRGEGCYRVSTAEAVPTLVAPWDAMPTPRSETDHLLQHVGTSPAAARPAGGELDVSPGEHDGQREGVSGRRLLDPVSDPRHRRVEAPSRGRSEDQHQPIGESAPAESLAAARVLERLAGGDESGAASGL